MSFESDDALGNSGPGWPFPEETVSPIGDKIPHVCEGLGEEIDWWQPDEYTVTQNNGGMNAGGF